MPIYNPGLAIGSPYGPRSYNGHKIHYGQDFPALKGSVIPAASSGVVVFSGLNTTSSYGNVVVIKSTGPQGAYFTLYAHMELSSPLKVGDSINIGDTIGFTGNTGGSGIGYHLHFEVLPETKDWTFKPTINSNGNGSLGVLSGHQVNPSFFNGWGDGGSPYGANSPLHMSEWGATKWAANGTYMYDVPPENWRFADGL